MTNFLYSVEREFPTLLENLWSAWTDASALEKWHHPIGMSCPDGTVRSEIEVGGIWTYAVEVPGREVISYFYGKYTEVEPEKHFRHTMHYTESLEAFRAMNFDAPAHEITVQFEVRPAGSWSKFSQYGQAPAEQVVMMTQGIESYFDSLENFLKSS